MLGCATPVRAENAGAMCVIHNQNGSISLAEFDQLIQRGQISIHGVDSLDCHVDVAAIMTPRRLQQALELGKVVVRKLPRRYSRQLESVAKRGMAVRIEEHHVMLLHQSGN